MRAPGLEYKMYDYGRAYTRKERQMNAGLRKRITALLALCTLCACTACARTPVPSASSGPSGDDRSGDEIEIRYQPGTTDIDLGGVETIVDKDGVPYVTP